MDEAVFELDLDSIQLKTSTVYWCIASKLKIPLIVYGMNKRFCAWIYHVFNRSYSDGITTTKMPTGHWRYYHSRCRLPRVMWAAMEPGVHTMSDELILQISCNIFLAFKLILMMTSGQNIPHYMTAKLSVYVCNHDLIWWRNKMIHKNISTRLRLRALEP